MQFRPSTILLLAVLLASSIGVFGVEWGIGAFLIVLSFAFCVSQVRTWPTGLVWWTIIAALVGVDLLLPRVGSGPGSSRIACSNNLKQIALGLHNYHAANGCFPPAYVTDKNGRRMHSWRALILPYVEGEPLYGVYDFNEPWDGPNNRKLIRLRPAAYSCPGEYAQVVEDPTRTAYLAVVGTNAAWPGTQARSTRDPALAGKLDTTIMLIETADSNIAWSQPDDLPLDDLESTGKTPKPTVSSWHGSRNAFFFTEGRCTGANVALANTSTRWLPLDELAPELLRESLRIGGCQDDAPGHATSHKKAIPHGPLPTRETIQLNWGNCFIFAVWLLAVGVVLFRANAYGKQLVADKREPRRRVDDRDEKQAADES